MVKYYGLAVMKSLVSMRSWRFFSFIVSLVNFDQTMKKAYLFLTILTLLFKTGCKLNKSNSMQIDHVILAINDLDSGIEQFEALTGMTAEYGGGHENGNTHNAIVALDDMVYVEILAPKNDIDTIPDFFKNIKELTPIGFALSVDNMESLEKSVLNAQFKTEGIEDWSRIKPNGDKLEWTLLRINNPSININPFFISWSLNTVHPSLQMKSSGSLARTELVTLHKNDIEKVLGDVNSRISRLTIKKGDTLRFSFELQTPKGLVSFE